MAGNPQYCTFFLDRYFFAVDVLKVQEVLPYQKMTRVPLAPAEVSGLINLRGRIVIAIDLRRRLRLRERPDGQAPMNVVVCTEDGEVSLLVDDIGDVLEMDDSLIEAPPEIGDQTARDLVRGVYKLQDQLLLVLDSERVVNLSNTNNASSEKAAI